jgi:hypothetical protein
MLKLTEATRIRVPIPEKRYIRFEWHSLPEPLHGVTFTAWELERNCRFGTGSLWCLDLLHLHFFHAG